MLRDLGKLIVAKGFKKLPKVQKIAQSGHTDCGLVGRVVASDIRDPRFELRHWNFNYVVSTGLKRQA